MRQLFYKLPKHQPSANLLSEHSDRTFRSNHPNERCDPTFGPNVPIAHRIEPSLNRPRRRGGSSASAACTKYLNAKNTHPVANLLSACELTRGQARAQACVQARAQACAQARVQACAQACIWASPNAATLTQLPTCCLSASQLAAVEGLNLDSRRSFVFAVSRSRWCQARALLDVPVGWRLRRR